MGTHLLSGAEIIGYAESRPPGVGVYLVQALWFIAGAAMLLFAVFLAVLLVAGILFRLAPRTRRPRPAVVFGIATALVGASVTALVMPGSVHNVTAAPAGSVRAATAAGRQLVGLYAEASEAASQGTGGSFSGSGLPKTTARSLVLYDTSGPSPEAEELFATALGNLVSHFGSWKAHPVDTYRSGEMTKYDAVLYLGEPGATALPSAFLDDVAKGKSEVLWVNGDIEQLQARSNTVAKHKYGFTAQGFSSNQLDRLEYKGSELPMDQDSAAGFMRIAIDDPKNATVLARAFESDGASVPWAVRSGNLIYVSENPLRSQGYLEGRNTAFADLLFEVLDPTARQRHRALVRLEDVNPTTEPSDLRAITDYLSGQRVPFSIGLFPVFRDPNDKSGGPDGVTVRLSERPELVAELRYALAHGGSLVLHGLTHQYGTKNNPVDGTSGEDTEFFLCHQNDQGELQLDGPVPEDSEAWVLSRVDAALAELTAAGLPKPASWEFSHYLASAVDYFAVAKRFEYRYERALYYPGILSGQPFDHSNPFGQSLSYPVRDVYGATVIPENLDYVSSDGATVPGMLDAARNNLVVRDGVASFFYHPFLGVGQLPTLVDGLRGLGYTFASSQSVAGSS